MAVLPAMSVAPNGAPTPHLSSTGILGTAAAVAAGAAGLSALGTRLAGHRITPLVTGGPFVLAAVLGSVVGPADPMTALTRPHEISTATAVAEELEVDHVVR